MSPCPESQVTIRWIGYNELATEGGANEAKQFIDKINATEAGGELTLEYDASGDFLASSDSVVVLEAKLDAADPGWTEDGRYYLNVGAVRGNLPGP